MSEKRPSYLAQGEAARLFPVLSTTSKEGRTTSIFLACLSMIDEFGAAILERFGQRVGKTAKIETYTEVVPQNRPTNMNERPDGLIVLKIGQKDKWRALVEAKVGNSILSFEQIDKYRNIANSNDIDCVITLSNQFSASPSIHPIEEVNKKRSKIPVYHLSWMNILTEAELLIGQDGVADVDQRILLNELRRFLTHESAGVKGFDSMPQEWNDINKLISSGGTVPPKSTEAIAVLNAWHQETKDLSLILSRMTEAHVSEVLSRQHRSNPASRLKDEFTVLRDTHELKAVLDIPNAASPLHITANISRRSIDASMILRAPEDKVSTKARLNWLLRQIKHEKLGDVHLELMWPGKASPTMYSIQELRENPELASKDREHLSPHSFRIVKSVRLGARFTQRLNFIVEIEKIVPEFYRDIGSQLAAWQKPAPQIKKDKSTADEVTTEAIAEDAREYRP